MAVISFQLSVFRGSFQFSVFGLLSVVCCLVNWLIEKRMAIAMANSQLPIVTWSLVYPELVEGKSRF